MALAKKKASTGLVTKGAIVSYLDAEGIEEEDVEIEHTADGDLEVRLVGLGVAAEDTAALRCIEAVVAEAAGRA